MDLPARPHAFIDSLPPESLVAVFYKVSYEPVELIQLALVCRSWRDIVLGTSELWNRITIPWESRESRIRRQLELSGEALLVLDLTRDSTIGSLTRLILGWNSPRLITERVSSLKITVRGEADVEGGPAWQLLCEGHSWPQLKNLELYWHSHSSELRPHLRAPNLETLHLQSTQLRDWDYIGLGPAFYDLKWMGFPGDDVAPFFRAATRCPNLRRLIFQTDIANLKLSEMLMETPLWPKLTEIDFQGRRTTTADILAILVNAPHLTLLRLQFDTPAQSNRLISYRAGFARGLRELHIGFTEEPDGWSKNLLRLTFLQSIVDLYDLASLEKVTLGGLPIMQCRIPAFCPQLQEIQLCDVTVPHDFMESLGQCPLVHRITTYNCGIRDTSIAAGDEILKTGNLVFDGRKFPAMCTQLRTISLHDAALYPQLVVQLAQCPYLNDVDLRVLSVSSDPSIAEADWNDSGVQAILPLPNLCNLRIDLDPTRGAPSIYSLITPAARYLVSASTQLARNMPLGNILLRLAPLQVVDMARLLQSDRGFSDVVILISSPGGSPETLEISLTADVAAASPVAAGERRRRPPFTLTAGIKRTELSGAADVILDRFPLDSDIKRVGVDKATMATIRMASKQNPDAVGLQYLLRRAKISVGNQSHR